jgi:hypothetical protein
LDLLGNILQVVMLFFKMILTIFIQFLIGDYFGSPYFITKVILIILSFLGIWLGTKNSRTLWIGISLIILIGSFGSLMTK